MNKMARQKRLQGQHNKISKNNDNRTTDSQSSQKQTQVGSNSTFKGVQIIRGRKTEAGREFQSREVKGKKE